MNKKCKKCNRIKPIHLFYEHKKMIDGHLSFCKKCVKERIYKRAIIKKEYIREYERKRNQQPDRKLRESIRQKIRRAKNPRKYKAWQKVSNAIRDGRLIKQPCEICGELKVEAHHPDHRSAFKIRWLCHEHHRQVTYGIIKLK